MSPVMRSLLYATVNAFHPRMLWLMIWPMLVAAGFWLVVALMFWTRVAVLVASYISAGLDWIPFAAALGLADYATLVAHGLLFLFFIPVVIVTALFILGVFGMPAIVGHVAADRYPALEKRAGGSAAGSVWNGLVALGGLLLLGVASLPLWIFPPLWPLIPVAIFAWVNQRVLRYDALAEHADADEMRAIFKASRPTLYVLGLALALVSYIPIVGFLAPVVVALAFTRFLLGELEALRSAPVATTAPR